MFVLPSDDQLAVNPSLRCIPGSAESGTRRVLIPALGTATPDLSLFPCSEFACDFTEAERKLEVILNTAYVWEWDTRQAHARRPSRVR
jgi:hypothetical protein